MIVTDNHSPPLSFFIGSGKGGVGKSTITINLAIALAKLGQKVGVIDADVYGPSLPIMMGLRRLSPRIFEAPDRKERIIPFTKFGIQVISLGFFIEEARSVVWRGPMLHATLQKMLQDVEWGELDLILIDLPPGTGDVPLTLSKMIRVDGALVVTTPQEVAMLDAIKAINAFDQLNVTVKGIVENMAGFTPPHSHESYPIFGEGKGAELASRFETRLLHSIPLIPEIRLGGDEGCPSAVHNTEHHCGRHFHQLAQAFQQECL